MNFNLLLCALFGHKKTEIRHAYARLQIPHAEQFVAAICFRCDHIYEDNNATPTEYVHCEACPGNLHPAPHLN
jgi:hypothetical protein